MELEIPSLGKVLSKEEEGKCVTNFEIVKTLKKKHPAKFLFHLNTSLNFFGK